MDSAGVSPESWAHPFKIHGNEAGGEQNCQLWGADSP